MIFAAGLLFALAMFWQAMPGNRHESPRGDSLAAASLASTVDNQSSSAAPHAVGIQAAAFGPALPEQSPADEAQPDDSSRQSLPLHLAGNSVGREPRPPTIRHGRFLRITSVRLGQRLVGTNPIREQAELIEPDQETWRHLSLSMGKSDGGRLWIELLRPIAWIEQQQATVGGEIYLDLEELGAVGWATVNAILPCPEIEPGEGTVVTGTFKHQANEQTRVLRLALEGQAETTGVTDNHPYWSVDRQEFIPAGELRPGELVDTVFGERRVESVTPIAADDPTFDGYLYNLETTEHVYRVGTLATLVHNKGPGERVEPALRSNVVARYGSTEQRQFLLNSVRETGSLREAKGVVYSFREMRRLGYQLENVSLHYRGNQGLDLIFSRGGTFAVVEAKAGSWLSSLQTYGGLRQGSDGYNVSRLQRYLDFGDGTHDAFGV